MFFLLLGRDAFFCSIVVSPALLSVSSFSEDVYYTHLSSTVTIVVQLVSSKRGVMVTYSESLELSQLAVERPPPFGLVFERLLQSIASPDMVQFLSMSRAGMAPLCIVMPFYTEY